MPTTKTLEDALRQLGWSPVADDASIVTRAWVHPEFVVIRVPRALFVDRRTFNRIMRTATRMPYR